MPAKLLACKHVVLKWAACQLVAMVTREPQGMRDTQGERETPRSPSPSASVELVTAGARPSGAQKAHSIHAPPRVSTCHDFAIYGVSGQNTFCGRSYLPLPKPCLTDDGTVTPTLLVKTQGHGEAQRSSPVSQLPTADSSRAQTPSMLQKSFQQIAAPGPGGS